MRIEAEEGEREEVHPFGICLYPMTMLYVQYELNNRLTAQVKQMEAFLKDYNMVWVGDDPVKKKMNRVRYDIRNNSKTGEIHHTRTHVVTVPAEAKLKQKTLTV